MPVYHFLYAILAVMLIDICLPADTWDIGPDALIQTPLDQSPLFPLLLSSLKRQKHAPDCSEKIRDEYDYIIVGAGSAGSVVASRLSEVPCVTVLLLEAGPKPPLITEVPGLRDCLTNTYVEWKYDFVPQKHLSVHQTQEQMRCFSGKMLGGSSSHNHMVYVRGNHKNYDDWAAQGAKGWSYKDVLPYFLKLEDNRNFPQLDKGYHAFGGPITVERPHFHSRVIGPFYEAVKELGYEFVDPNGAKQTGFYEYQMSTRNGQRCSTSKAYLVPAEHRRNLDIVVNATVTKVIVENKEAKGVVFYHNGEYKFVKVRQEVIVSGGTMNTPKLLMLSGIGPREELENWNIPVASDLPVGKNLQDHGVVGYFFTVDPQYKTKNKLSNPSTIREYINSRSGPLSYTGMEIIAFLNGLSTAPASDFPNYQLFFIEITKDYGKDTGLAPEINNQYFGPIDGNRTIFICWSYLLQPNSIGELTLSSNNPFDPPVIDPNYLADPEDVDDIVDGLRVCQNFVNTAAAKSLGATPFHTLMPGCEKYATSDVDYFRCFTRSYFIPGLHMVGTSKMGDPMDPSTVVDPELRVKGIKRLRVVDASVMPIVPSGNTNIPTIMVAEKASDIIKKSMQCF